MWVQRECQLIVAPHRGEDGSSVVRLYHSTSAELPQDEMIDLVYNPN